MSTLHANQDLINLIKQTILDTSHPVGSTFIARKNIDPNETLGGTWKKLYGGFIYACKDTADDHAANTTGAITGSTVLSVAQLPAHRHNGSTRSSGSHQHSLHLTTGSGSNDSYFRVSGSGNVDWGIQSWVGGWSNWAGDHTHSFTTNNTGSGKGHTHDMSRIGVFIWERTA